MSLKKMILLCYFYTYAKCDNSEILKKIASSLAALAISTIAYNKTNDQLSKQNAMASAIGSIENIVDNVIDIICTKEIAQEKDEFSMSRYDYFKKNIDKLEKKSIINFNKKDNIRYEIFNIFFKKQLLIEIEKN